MIDLQLRILRALTVFLVDWVFTWYWQ